MRCRVLTRALSSSARRARSAKVAAVQLAVSESRDDNIQRASSLISEAAARGAEFIALPECFVGKYGVDRFEGWQEDVPSEASATDLQSGFGAAMMALVAKRHSNITVTGGVVECANDGQLFNSMPVYSGPAGRLVANYRKVHLSRVLGITSEADVFSEGNSTVRFDLPSGVSVGMACCFDLRFPRFLDRYWPRSTAKGEAPVDVLCAPSAFLHVTGVDHWELLCRRAALDGQGYVVAPNIAFDSDDAVPLYGHTMIVDPWGTVVARCEAEGDGIAIADVELDRVDEVRGRLPISQWEW